MKTFFMGGEIGTHRTILQDVGALNIGLSYMGLRRRVKFVKPWLIREKFLSYTNVFLDSGAYTVNVDEEADPDGLIEIFEHYKDFVLDNINDVVMVSEFDALPLGHDWVAQQRTEFWDTLPREKVMVIWHPEQGTGDLLQMAEDYEIIGIPAVSLDGKNLAPILNALAAKGTRIHGIGTKIESMQNIRWSSVASTSWVSPKRFGDTIVWTGKELKRYPKKMKDQARKQHRTLFKNNGFDADKIAADEGDEILRLSIWSWLQFEEYINNHHKTGMGVTTAPPVATFSNAENVEEAVDTVPPEDGTDVTTPTKEVTVRREPIMLPLMQLTRAPAEDEDEEDGPPTINVRSESMRMCNSCFLAEKCPGYLPDSNCAYNIPVTVRTREQFKALQYGLVEMQTQRVLFMQMIEQVEGGYADPNLSKEMGLLQKMMATTSDMEKEGFSLSVNVSGKGDQRAASGVFSNLFGREATSHVDQIEGGPYDADNIIEAEVISDE